MLFIVSRVCSSCPSHPSGQAGGSGRRPGGQAGGAGGRRGDPATADAQFAKQIMELDSNRNNLISIDELPLHMHGAFKIADADQNGEVNSKELLVLAGEFRRNKLNPDGENAEMKIGLPVERPIEDKVIHDRTHCI